MNPLKSILKRALGVIVFSIAFWLSAELLAPSWAQANLPVIDVTAISQMMAQYVQMTQQLETLYQQVTLLKQQVGSITGHYGMGSLGNPVNSWGVTTWADIANMVGQGINPGDAVQVQAYKEAQAACVMRFPVLSTDLQSANPRMNAAYSRNYSDAIAGMSLGEETFNQVNDDLADVQTLKDRIDQTDNLKAAMDLNTAVSVRVAQLDGEILRMQAAQLRVQAGNTNDAANGYAAQAEFFAE